MAEFGRDEPTYPGTGGTPPAAPTPKKRKLKWLWITLAVVLVLLVACGGGVVYVVGQFAAPVAAATQFCGDLKAQSYASAYGRLSSTLRRQYTGAQFAQGNQALDQIAGQVTACGSASDGNGNALSYSLGASTAVVRASVTRQKQGTLTGTLHLKNEAGAWKVDAIDASLLGVHLGALQTAATFCASLQQKDYPAAYGLLSSANTSQLSQADFSAAAALWDQLDGVISSCSLVGLGHSNSDTAASLTVSVTRASRGTQTGAMTLGVEGGAWKVGDVDPALLGSDVQPLVAGIVFCDAVIKGDFETAYALLSSGLAQDHSQADFKAFFALPNGLTYVSCTPKLSTYKVSATSASYSGDFKISDGSTVPFDVELVQEGGSWKIDAVSLG